MQFCNLLHVSENARSKGMQNQAFIFSNECLKQTMNFHYCLEQDKDLSCLLGTTTSGVRKQTPVCETLPRDG